MRSASCTCGRLTVTAEGEPVRVSLCHCLACQRRTGSVFAVQARFPSAAVSISGASSQYVRIGDSGSRTTFHFCAACGSTVYYTNSELADQVAIPVGAFADPDFPAPEVSVYEERMHAWVILPEDIDHRA